MKNIRLFISIILFVSFFVLQIVFHRGTQLYYLFVLLYALSIGFLSHELGKKLGVKKIKLPKVFSYLAVSFAVAGIVFCIESLFNMDLIVKIYSVASIIFIAGIMFIVYLFKQKKTVNRESNNKKL